LGSKITSEFLLLVEVMACKGGEDTRRKAITGWLSGRGRESNERRKVWFRWRNSQEEMQINLKQFLLLLSFMHLVSEALIKHFAIIQRLKIIASMNKMAKCRNISYKKHEVSAQ